MRRMRFYFMSLLVLLTVTVLLSSSCGNDDSDDDDVEDADKEQVLCNKIEACGFEDDLEIDDCVAYAGELSDWLMDCAMKADGCRDLAECYNLPEGV